jgi:hypothetical protein
MTFGRGLYERSFYLDKNSVAITVRSSACLCLRQNFQRNERKKEERMKERWKEERKEGKRERMNE